MTLSLVAGALEFATASETRPTAMPAAYIILLREQPSPSDVANAVVQRIRVSLAVVLALRNAADAKGQAAQADLETLRATVQTALLGWAPTDAAPLERGPGQLLAFRDGVLWWQDVYDTEIYVRS